MVPILGYELSGQLDCLHLLVCEMNVGDLELISRRWVKIFEQISLLSLLKGLDLLPQLVLEVVSLWGLLCYVVVAVVG